MKDINVQAQNKINLVGKLLDFNPAEGTTRDGRKYERANATIRVTQSYSGHEETSEIPVSFFVTQYTSTGKTNPAWTSFQELKTYNTAQNVGIDAADTIRVTGCTISENNFVSNALHGSQTTFSYSSLLKIVGGLEVYISRRTIHRVNLSG